MCVRSHDIWVCSLKATCRTGYSQGVTKRYLMYFSSAIKRTFPSPPTPGSKPPSRKNKYKSFWLLLPRQGPSERAVFSQSRAIREQWCVLMTSSCAHSNRQLHQALKRCQLKGESYRVSAQGWLE